MDGSTYFRSNSKSTISDGDYTVIVEFSGLKSAVYPLKVRNGTCLVIFAFRDCSGLDAELPLILDRYSMAVDGTFADFRVLESLPSPYHSLSTNDNILSNLVPPKILRGGANLGYVVNGKLYLKINGKMEWSNFPNFLVDFVRFRIGNSWIASELGRPEADWHPFVRLDRMFMEKMSSSPLESPGVHLASIANGIVRWYIDLAYNLYWIDSNEGLDAEFVRRLRSKDQFWSTVHEIFVAAAFTRAGFSLKFEDESDGSEKHPEFVATHKKTGDIVTVEAKALRRQQIVDFRFSDWSIASFRPIRLLNDAVKKAKRVPHLIVLDVNYPPLLSEEDKVRFNDRIAKIVNQFHPVASETQRDGWNAIYFVNRPFLFTEGTTHPCVYSVLGAWTAFPAVEHPNILVGAAINQALVSIGDIDRELEFITSKIK